MQGPIHKSQRRAVNLLLLAISATFISCASDKKPSLVDDPDAKKEGQMPWNKQEKWETQGQMSGITDRR
jgi:hypothetical protein